MIQLINTRENATLFPNEQVVQSAFEQLPHKVDYWVCRASVEARIHKLTSLAKNKVFFVGVVREQTTNRIIGYLYQE